MFSQNIFPPLIRHKINGGKIFWLNITNMKEEYGYSKEIVEKRKQQIHKVKLAYKMDGYYDLGLCPAHLDKYDSGEIIDKISKVFDEVKPEVILLPNRYDVHSDHKKAFDWCYSCTKVFRYPFIKKILTMEILSETDFGIVDEAFVPNYFVDITGTFEQKKDILKIYDGELGIHPFPRSLEGLEAIAKVRGISAGTRYAEAFHIMKMID